ncbi:hypothetical protein PV410_18210 [Streptomyces sp. PA03-5A]|nr:hypothetical protein [Streptomyces sp. PA03-5A]
MAGAVAGGLLLAPPAHAARIAIVGTTINNGKPIVMGAGGSTTVTVPVVTEIAGVSGAPATVDAELTGLGSGFSVFLEGTSGANMTSW